LKNNNGNIETDVDCPESSALAAISPVTIENDLSTAANLGPIHNPLKNLPSDFMDLFIQSALSIHAGKLYLKGKGNSLTQKLLSNADLFQQETHKTLMNKRLEEEPQYAMLLNELEQVNNIVQQNTILYLPSSEINPYQSQGDVSANVFEAKTTGDQTHANNRIVARDLLCVLGKNITRRTESYITVSYIEDSIITEYIAMPKQTFICLNGDMKINADEKIASTSTTTIANNFDQKAKQIVDNTLILQKTVQTKHDSGSFLNSSETIEITTTNKVLPSIIIAKNNLTKEAADFIDQKSTHDMAGERAKYSAKDINISGTVLVDTYSKTSTKSNGFTEHESKTYTEQANFNNASITAKNIEFHGNSTVLAACDITGKKVEDHTQNGLHFKPIVQEIRYFVQQTVNSPLMEADAGCEGGATVMTQCQIQIDKLVRMVEGGEIVLDSVIWKDQKPEIIGKTNELTQSLKQWHTSWAKVNQIVPDGVLVIVSVAVTFATYGTGATLCGSLGGVIGGSGAALTGVSGAMASAAFTTLCNAAAVNFLTSGDPLVTAKTLVNNDFLRSLAINVASAGITQAAGLNVTLPSDTSSLLDYAQYAAARAIVNIPLTCVIGRRPIKEVLIQEGANAAMETISGYSAGKIGLMYRQGDLTFLQHKAMHTVAGAVSGAVTNTILKKDVIEGALSGAIGATIGEMACETMPMDSIDTTVFTSKVIAGTVAGLLGQDVNLSVKTSAITIENNWVQCLQYINAALLALGLTCAAKDAKEAYDEKNDINDAIDVLVLHGIIMRVSAGSVNFGSKMFALYKNAWKFTGGTVANTTALTASSVVNRDLLYHQLMVQEKMGEVGKIFAGQGSVPFKAFRNESHFIEKYGGQTGDWVKKTSTNFTTKSGQMSEIHWVENVVTGQRIDFKPKWLGK
jgi:hypothetical protein